MNFKDCQSVTNTIIAGEQVEIVRSNNRVVVNNLFNGEKPLTDAEAKQWGMPINVNWGEGPVLAAQARRQYTNAFQRPARYFKVSIPDAPVDKKDTWEMQIGTFINRVLKDSLPYFYLGLYKFASTVAHGIGPQMWEDRESWRPRYVAIEDLRVPTDTEVSFENLEWFAVRHRYTEGELAAKVWNENAPKGWNKDVVAKILDRYHESNTDSFGATWINQPERMAELVKQNGGFYSSDAVPSIPLWHFFFKQRDDKTGEVSWLLRIVPDVNGGCMGATDNEFIYDSDKVWANELSEILHCQFGDLNNVPPFRYHSVRSLGFLLVEPCFFTNLARCRTLQHLFESFNTWFRVTDPTGRARAQKIELFDKAIVEEGVSVVPQTERHQVNPQLIDMVMGQLKQLQGEAGAAYTQQLDNGTAREQTAYETSVKVAQVNAMMSGMLLVAFFQEKFAYREICRRFCIRGSSDPDVQKFQKKMKRLGIPEAYLDVEMWDVDPEVPLGAGNPTMEISQANQLMAMRPFLSPEAQDKVTHMAIAATTQNPALAQDLKPLGEKPVANNGAKWASAIFGTLMQGVPVPQNDAVPAADQAETLLGLLAGVVARIEQQTNLATNNELVGLQTVAQYVGALVQQIQQDPANAPKAKQIGTALMEITNILKGFQQRLAQQAAAAQPNPEDAAKVQGMVLQAQTKNQIAQANAAQKLQHKNQAFEAEQARKNAALLQDEQRKSVQTGAEIHRNHVQTKAEIEAANLAAISDPAGG